MSNEGLTLGIICDVSSANYGEGIGNISELKKITRNGKTYTRISRQAICYNLRTQMGYPLAPVKRKLEEIKADDETVENKPDKKKHVIQFSTKATVEDFAEIDLFGYMRTAENSSADYRSAVIRVSDAISLYPYSYDMDFLTNRGLASRINENSSIVNSEIHSSLYAYTVCIDLNDVGVLNGKNVITNEEKAKRVCAMLSAVEHLYRDIRGRRENMAPVFIIGGIYPNKNNYFAGRLTMKGNSLSVQKLLETMEDESIKINTNVGLLSDVFENEKEIRETFNAMSIHQFFEDLRSKVKDYYKKLDNAKED